MGPTYADDDLESVDMNDSIRDENFIKISVRNPITHNTWEDGKYTSYEILLETGNIAFTLFSSSVRRRYREFVWLREQLKKHHTNVRCPRLPPKKYFDKRFQPDFIMDRRKGLEDFLQKCVEVTRYLSDSRLHLFLQTQLTVQEINYVVNGQSRKSVLQTIQDFGAQSDSASTISSASINSYGNDSFQTDANDNTDYSYSYSRPSPPVDMATDRESPYMVFSPKRDDLAPAHGLLQGQGGMTANGLRNSQETGSKVKSHQNGESHNIYASNSEGKQEASLSETVSVLNKDAQFLENNFPGGEESSESYKDHLNSVLITSSGGHNLNGLTQSLDQVDNPHQGDIANKMEENFTKSEPGPKRRVTFSNEVTVAEVHSC